MTTPAPPRTARSAGDDWAPVVRTAPRPLAEHDPDCARPGWIVQTPILTFGPLLAYCRGCSAVRLRRPKREQHHAHR